MASTGQPTTSADISFVTESTETIDPICGFVAATNIESLYSSWSCNSGGTTNSDPCAWDGIFCALNNNISSISLSGVDGLTGTLAPLLVNIPTVTAITVDQTKVHGTLPSYWGSFPRLVHLHLDSNSLSGTLPSSWGSLTRLVDLHLHSNSLSGTLPSSWGSLTQLNELSLYSNSLSGTLSSLWGSLTRLTYLDLSLNALTGTLPSSWGSLTRLHYLLLNSNSLSGTLPSSWGSLTQLVDLHLDSNSLSGTLPSLWVSFTWVDQLYLSSNSLSGTLPSSWGSLTRLISLDLSLNALTGTLPSSWGSLTRLTYLVLSLNALTGTLPPSWGSLPRLHYLTLSSNALSGTLPSSWHSLVNLRYLYLNQNAFSGSLPTTWNSLVSLKYLSLFENRLTGSVCLGWQSLVQLQYLYLNDNSFSATLPVAWGSDVLSTVDVSYNMLTGRLPTDQTTYPTKLKSLDVSYNSLSGTVPSAVALSTNISNLNVAHNDIVGSIPSGFCFSLGVSIDVGGTAINCYAGCLTSSFVIVEGASPDCHDGSILEHFVIISGVCGLIAIVCTALYRSHAWWSPVLGAASVDNTCSVLRSIGGNIIGRLCCACKGATVLVATEDRIVQDGPSKMSIIIFGMSVAKCVLGVTISLAINNWWTYIGGSGVPRNDDVLASCSNPTVGNCVSFCADVRNVSVNVTDDDIAVYISNSVTTEQPVNHIQSGSYCIATLPGYCGFEYWIDFKLVPILLQVTGLMLQVVLWRYGSGEFSATPQKAQYDLILDQLYPQVRRGAGERGGVGEGVVNLNPPHVTFAYRAALMRRLSAPVFPSIFWFLELATVVYVWGELLYPSVVCDSHRPLSLYYYPILMSLLDLMKLNIYVSTELWKSKRHLESVLILLDLQLFGTHLWVTVAMGLVFVFAVVRDGVLGLVRCVDMVSGRREQLTWTAERKTDAVEMRDIAGADNGAGAATSNPMLSGVEVADVEVAGIQPVASAGPMTESKVFDLDDSDRCPEE